MVRTRGGSRYRPRVRFSTPELEDPGTSGAAGAHSPDLHAVTQPTLAPFVGGGGGGGGRLFSFRSFFPPMPCTTVVHLTLLVPWLPASAPRA